MEPTLDNAVEVPEEERAHVEEAGFQAPLHDLAQSANADCRMIAFSLAGRDYGIDIMKIKEISHEGKFTYVPNAAPYVLGVYNLRGEIIPIIDLRRLFNLSVSQAQGGLEQNILILKLEKLILGVVVDSIEGVRSAPLNAIQAPHPIFSDINIRYISGIMEREGKLYIILDVERIFQESAPTQPAPIEAKTERRPPMSAEKTADQEFRFVCEGLSTFASFFVTPPNLAWTGKRFEEWRRTREKTGLSAQLRGVDDANEFLSSFPSLNGGELWGEELRNAFLALLPRRPTGIYVVWNHGCGRGFDSYSATCILKSAFPGLALRTWADDGNLVEIASAPTLTLPRERVPDFYIKGGFMHEGEAGCQFTPALRETVVFEYTESLARTESVNADLIISRDVLSFQQPETQKATLEAFAQRLKPGGLLILGTHEQMEGEHWRTVEQGGLRAFVRESAKE